MVFSERCCCSTSKAKVIAGSVRSCVDGNINRVCPEKLFAGDLTSKLCADVFLILCVLQALAAAREEEFEKWKGHLDSVEVALYAAQQESLTYR